MSQSVGGSTPTAPVQGGRYEDTKIPWDLHVRAWQVYAALGHRSQSAARIAERGGFGRAELAYLYAERDHKWRPLADHQAATLRRLRDERAEA